MKTIFVVVLSLLMATTVTMAQEKENQKKDLKATENRGKDDVFEEADDQKSKGNAFGKNKGNLSGKEFGQQRAEETKIAAQEKKAYAEQKISEQEERIQANEEKIEMAKEKVKKERVDGEISAEEEAIKYEKIEQAEEKVKKMKDAIAKGIKDIEALKEEILKSE